MSGYFKWRLFCDLLLCMEAILCLATLNGGYFVTGYFAGGYFLLPCITSNGRDILNGLGLRLHLRVILIY